MRRVGVVMVAALACAVMVPAVAPPAAGAVLQVTTPGPDFNNDGFGDLAVGAPGEDVGAATDAGAVNVLYGSAGGLGGAQVLTQGAGGVPGASESLDRFGTALTTGNFNSDGFADLAVGAPGEDLGAGDVDAGAVVILFGSAAGITGAGARLLTQTNPEPGDGFGLALAAVDSFNLAVGVPGEDVGAAVGAGAVSLIADAGTTPNEELLHQGVAGVVGTAEAGDAFGAAVIAGDFNQSEGLDSLAIGVPGEDVGAVTDAGAVNVRYAPGLGGGLELITQGRPETSDSFGAALSSAYFGRGVQQDLAVGAPGETVGNRPFAGAVTILYGDDSGFIAAGSQLFHQSGGGVPGTAETGDGLGTALAAGQYGGGVADLAIGVPAEDIGAVADAGILDVLYGTDAAGLGGGGSEQLTQQDAAGTVEPGDHFGQALSEPFFFLDDVLEDVAIGAPGETVNGRGAAGAGSVLFGAEPGGLGDGGGQFFFQGGGGLGGVAESLDQVGAALS